MDDVLTYLRSHQDLYVERLKEWVAIKSVSSDPKCRPLVNKMVNHVKQEFEQLGAKTDLKDIGIESMYFQGKKTELALPPVLFAELGNDPSKHTICIYGHLDVQPADISDGWATEPFQLTVDEEGRMFGRGCSDDKGQGVNLHYFKFQSNKTLSFMFYATFFANLLSYLYFEAIM